MRRAAVVAVLGVLASGCGGEDGAAGSSATGARVSAALVAIDATLLPCSDGADASCDDDERVADARGDWIAVLDDLRGDPCAETPSGEPARDAAVAWATGVAGDEDREVAAFGADVLDDLKALDAC